MHALSHTRPQITEMALKLFATGKDHRKIFVAITEYFQGKWAGERKPIAGKPKSALDRRVAAQVCPQCLSGRLWCGAIA